MCTNMYIYIHNSFISVYNYFVHTKYILTFEKDTNIKFNHKECKRTTKLVRIILKIK